MRLSHLFAVAVVGLGLALAPAFTPVLRADDTPKEKPRQGGGPGQYLERYRATIDKLSITSDQKSTIDTAFATAKTKIEAAVKDANGDRDAMKGKIGPIFKELTESIVAVLTPEQKEEFKKLHKERPKKDSN